MSGDQQYLATQSTFILINTQSKHSHFCLVIFVADFVIFIIITILLFIMQELLFSITR